MRCYRRTLKIHWTQKVTNFEVKRRLRVVVDIFQRLVEKAAAFSDTGAE